MIKITKNHIKLLQNAEWRMLDIEYEAPGIDPKRPYGNSSVEEDIREILNDESLNDDECWKLHYDLLEILKYICSNPEDGLNKYIGTEIL